MFSGGEYNEKRDGSLEEYFKTHDGGSAFPLFRGPKIYEQIWNKGYMVPEFTWLRLMWNIGRSDEHFSVQENGKLEGICDLKAHAGRSGVYSHTEIISDDPNTPCFELGNLKTRDREPPLILLGK
jgi:hypothetical protein|tara:strand:+ start:49 stop:423 length:375 start_codon:yes stop_codon:yes gene_type:complete